MILRLLTESTLRRTLTRLAIFVLLQAGLPFQAVAQDRILEYGELPEMALRVCVSVDGAEQQADLSKRLGLLSLESATASDAKVPNCRMLRIRARPLHIEPINPYVAWVPTYDKSSSKTVTADIAGYSHSLGYSYKRQLCRIYRAVITDGNGRRVEGWVEIPERPYVVEYMEEMRRNRQK